MVADSCPIEPPSPRRGEWGDTPGGAPAETGRAYLVRINLAALRANLSRLDQQDYTEAEIRRWLLDGGVEPRGDCWLLRESELNALDSSEVIEIEAVAARRLRGDGH